MIIEADIDHLYYQTALTIFVFSSLKSVYISVQFVVFSVDCPAVVRRGTLGMCGEQGFIDKRPQCFMEIVLLVLCFHSVVVKLTGQTLYMF